jgi:hypothetical protein
MEGPTLSGGLRNRLTRLNLHEHDDDDYDDYDYDDDDEVYLPGSGMRAQEIRN